jgi:hypothetical protein
MANEIVEQQAASMQIVNGNDYMIGLNELKTRANMVTKIKREIMRENVHWGKVPGCGDKPTLLKNGAELLCMAFKLAPDAKVDISDLGNGHREYTVTTTLLSIVTGTPIATGLGSCSTMESKYRYRGAELVNTGKPVPQDYWDERDPALLGGKGFVAKKDDNGKWMIFAKGEKRENQDIADVYNTVLKMASKRSLVDATLKATGGSCEFTQDIEDLQEYAVYKDAQPQTSAPHPQKKEIDEETKQFMDGMKGLWTQAPEIYKSTMDEFGFKSANNVPPERRTEVFCTIQANITKAAQQSATTAQEQQDSGEVDNSLF